MAAAKRTRKDDSLLGTYVPPHARLNWTHTLTHAVIWLGLWLIPVAAIVMAKGRGNVFSEIAVFFSEMAVVTFGGAYAVLAYVAQTAVQHYQWLSAGEMLDGLGMAETTPGPLIMVLQFVGFMAAFRDPGALHPMLAGTLGGLLATWVTFAPCFLWIFVGAPFIEHLRGNKALNGALSAITAAVVGVDPQSGDLVRDPRRVSRGGARPRLRLELRRAGAGERRSLRSRALARGDDRDLPLQGRNAACARRVVGDRRRRFTWPGSHKKRAPALSRSAPTQRPAVRVTDWLADLREPGSKPAEPTGSAGPPSGRRRSRLSPWSYAAPGWSRSAYCSCSKRYRSCRPNRTVQQ